MALVLFVVVCHGRGQTSTKKNWVIAGPNTSHDWEAALAMA